MTKQESAAHVYLKFLPDHHYFDSQGTEWWLEPAEDIASDIIRQTHIIRGKKVMRSKRRDDPRVYNHWRCLV